MAAMHKAPAVGDAGELLKWLFQVTANRCRLEHRRSSRWRRVWSSLVLAWTSEESWKSPVGYGELKAEVGRALDTLSEADRSLVAMRYFSDLNSRQIGEIAGMPEATVRGRLRAARRKLAEELAEWNEAD
jgi:RNA polymerase sigma-70 factor (ECF subfamily)